MCRERYEAVQIMPLSIGCRSRKPIVSKYREATAVPWFCSANDRQRRRVTWSDVREMFEGLGEGPSLKLERQVAETNWLMTSKPQIEIQGQILRLRDNKSTMDSSQLHPGRLFRTQDVSFAYDVGGERRSPWKSRRMQRRLRC